MRECCRRSDVDVSEVSLPSQLPSPPLPLCHTHTHTHTHSLTNTHALTLSLAFLVMRCRWAETRPHVSAGFAASSAPIISSLPWHRAQRQLTARHLTAASHAWTPDTVTARTKSAVSCRNTQFKVRCVFTNRLTGKLPGRELASSPTTAVLVRHNEFRDCESRFCKRKGKKKRSNCTDWAG